ncbi:hypothetical protein [Streptomyces microflavus]
MFVDLARDVGGDVWGRADPMALDRPMLLPVLDTNALLMGLRRSP